MERILTEANVPRASFYRHFQSKEELVCEYLTERHQALKTRADQIIPGLTEPKQALGALLASVSEELCEPGFRGCAFIKAASEYPDPQHPVFEVVADHRRWFRQMLTDTLRQTGHPQPESVAGILVLLHDGAVVGGYLDDVGTSQAALGFAMDLLTKATVP